MAVHLVIEGSEGTWPPVYCGASGSIRITRKPPETNCIDCIRAHFKAREKESMSETRFTPGPWRLREVTRFGKRALEIYDARGNTLWVQWEGVRDNDLANARLIASAPDLYEACEGLFGLMSQDAKGDWCFNALSSDWPAFQVAMKQMRVALARATREAGEDARATQVKETR